MVITDKDKRYPTTSQLRRADDLFQFSVKEKRELYGDGNRDFVRAGLCDGQRCINHKFLPDRRGCYCKFSGSNHPLKIRRAYKDAHLRKCSLNGQNNEPEFGCNGYAPDHTKEHERARPAYQQQIEGRNVTTQPFRGRKVI